MWRSPTPRPQKSPLKSLIELVITVAIAVGLALLIQAFIVKPYRIPSPSMVPTLEIGQRVLTNRLINHPSVGDIVVFHPPKGADPADAGVRQPQPGRRARPGAATTPTAAASRARRSSSASWRGRATGSRSSTAT